MSGSRYVRLTSHENLDDKRTASFELLTNSLLKTSHASTIRVKCRDISERSGMHSERLLFNSWYGRAFRSRLQPMVTPEKVLKPRLEHIAMRPAHPLTNAAAEGLNTRIQTQESAARLPIRAEQY